MFCYILLQFFINKLIARLTSAFYSNLSSCKTNFQFAFSDIYSDLILPLIYSIIIKNALVFEYTKPDHQKSVCKSNFCLSICFTYSFRILLPVFYFSNSGFKQMSSAEITFNPSFSIAFLSSFFKACFMGVEPRSLGLVVLLM